MGIDWQKCSIKKGVAIQATPFNRFSKVLIAALN